MSDFTYERIVIDEWDFSKKPVVRESFVNSNRHFDEYGYKCIVLTQVGSFFELYAISSLSIKQLIDTEIQHDENNYIGTPMQQFVEITGCECSIRKCNVKNNKTNDAHNICMAGFPDYKLDKFINMLLNHKYNVVVYKQDTNSDNTTRSLMAIYSTGTYVTNNIVESPSGINTNNTMSVWFEIGKNFNQVEPYIHVGIANIDVFTGKTSIFEFSEKYKMLPTTFDNLERFISQTLPSEIIFISAFDTNLINKILGFIGIDPLKTSIHLIDTRTSLKTTNCEKQKYQKAIIEKFYGKIDKNIYIDQFYKNCMSAQAFCYLLDFIYEHNPYLVKNLSTPNFENTSDKLVLANQSLKQLNIIDTQDSSGQYSSVLKLLNKCNTPMGKRLFTYGLLNPITDIDVLQSEYDIIGYLIDYPNIDTVYKKFKFIKDIPKIIQLIYMGRMKEKNLFYMYISFGHIHDICSEFNKDEIFKKYMTLKGFDFEQTMVYLENIRKHISERIDFNKCMIVNKLGNESIIKRGTSQELDDIEKIVLDSQDIIEVVRIFLIELMGGTNSFVTVHSTEKSPSVLKITKIRGQKLEDIITKTVKREHKLTYKSKFTNEMEYININLDDIRIVSSEKTSIIEIDFLQKLCKKMLTVENEHSECIIKTYIEIVKQIGLIFGDDLHKISDCIAQMDVVLNKATISKKNCYCKPEFRKNNHSFVEITHLRHALIEKINQNELYTTNDANFNGVGTLIYGTNAAGKTSYIRAVGIAVIMAQAGMWVPATTFVYKPFTCIFTRILGNDNIHKGMSTLGTEMSELSPILKSADENSLVIGDELCSGTETPSAIGIFVASLMMLKERNVNFVFATHLHEIVDMSEIEGINIQHMSAKFDKNLDTLVYNRALQLGSGETMYGLEVCKSIGMPQDFLELANYIRMKYYPEAASILTSKTSVYNRDKIRNICEKCGKRMSTETHHKYQQKDADKNGFIRTENHTFHKNNKANLASLCEKCHQNEHKK